MKAENEYLRTEINTIYEAREIIGESPSVQKMLEQIDLVALSNTTVLMQGESGTGKELVAREIYHRSARRDLLLVRVKNRGYGWCNYSSGDTAYYSIITSESYENSPTPKNI